MSTFFSTEASNPVAALCGSVAGCCEPGCESDAADGGLVAACCAAAAGFCVAADALFPILLSTYYGASMVEQKLIWSAMAAGTPRHEIWFKVVLPAAVPSILTGCRIGLVISCIVVFLAEMITSTEGLGHLLVTAARTFQAVDMFVPLITISLLGLILNGLLQLVRSYLLRGFPEV